MTTAITTDPAVRAAADAYAIALAAYILADRAHKRAWSACGPAELTDPTIRTTYDRTRDAADAARAVCMELHRALDEAVLAVLVRGSTRPGPGGSMTDAIIAARAAYLGAIARHVDAELAEAMHDRRDYSPEVEARGRELSIARSAAFEAREAAARALRDAIRAAGGCP